MPNNENDFNLPKENTSNQTPENNNQQKDTPIIEIPQSYYDKIAKEKQEEASLNAKKEAERREIEANSAETKQLLSLSLVNDIIIFIGLLATVKISLYIFFIIPILIIALSIINSLKDKENTSYPTSVMVGGILSAITSFIISMINEENSDLYMYYTIASTIIGFLGFAIGSIINKYCTKRKEIKALETVGYIIFFIALVAVPYYFANKYQEEFYKIVFHTQVEVKAENEEEFVKKTIKARYNIEYTCARTKKYINEKNRPQIVHEECNDGRNNIFYITAIAYNEGSNQYVVSDTYLDTILLDPIKKTITEKIKIATSAIDVTMSLYPEENCFFYGDCVDCDEYYARYEKENDIERQYEISSTSNYEKYLNIDSRKFINEKKFKYIINIYGSYNDSTYNDVIEKSLQVLNDNGYKNTYGFIINMYNVIGSDYTQAFKRLAYKVEGKTNDSNTFGAYENLPVTSSNKR